jgi:hypothetical protein
MAASSTHPYANNIERKIVTNRNNVEEVVYDWKMTRVAALHTKSSAYSLREEFAASLLDDADAIDPPALEEYQLLARNKYVRVRSTLQRYLMVSPRILTACAQFKGSLLKARLDAAAAEVRELEVSEEDTSKLALPASSTRRSSRRLSERNNSTPTLCCYVTAKVHANVAGKREYLVSVTLGELEVVDTSCACLYFSTASCAVASLCHASIQRRRASRKAGRRVCSHVLDLVVVLNLIKDDAHDPPLWADRRQRLAHLPPHLFDCWLDLQDWNQLKLAFVCKSNAKKAMSSGLVMYTSGRSMSKVNEKRFPLNCSRSRLMWAVGLCPKPFALHNNSPNETELHDEGENREKKRRMKKESARERKSSTSTKLARKRWMRLTSPMRWHRSSFTMSRLHRSMSRRPAHSHEVLDLDLDLDRDLGVNNLSRLANNNNNNNRVNSCLSDENLDLDVNNLADNNNNKRKKKKNHANNCLSDENLENNNGKDKNSLANNWHALMKLKKRREIVPPERAVAEKASSGEKS